LPVTIAQPSLALAGSIAVTNISCFGDISGACNLTVTGGTSPYTYLWSNGAVTEDINNISAGNYSITITDSHGCTVVVNTVVTQPAVALNGSITSQSDVTVYGGNDGSVTISGSGGTTPYEYSLDGGNFQASGTFSSLTAGTYTITIRDAAMCTYDVMATITQPWIPLTANIITQINVVMPGREQRIRNSRGMGRDVTVSLLNRRRSISGFRNIRFIISRNLYYHCQRCSFGYI
jgi:hypothetical protein